MATYRDSAISRGGGRRSSGASSGIRNPVVFLSYRREDTEGHAGHLGEWLVGRFGKENVFRDIDSVQPGEDFFVKISNSIQSCDVVLVLIGKSWLSATDRTGRRRIDNPRDYVRLEIEAAFTNNVTTIPVLFQNAEMPSEEELPETIAGLSRLQASVIAAGRWDHDVGLLLSALENIARRSREEPHGPESTVAERKEPAWPAADNLLRKAGAIKRGLDNWPHPLGVGVTAGPKATRRQTKPEVGSTRPGSFCRRCGGNRVEGAKFCNKCGTPQSGED